VTSDPDFKVTTFLKSNIRKTARLKDKVTIAQEEIIPIPVPAPCVGLVGLHTKFRRFSQTVWV